MLQLVRALILMVSHKSSRISCVRFLSPFLDHSLRLSKAGDYTVVVSAFEPKYYGPFTIHVSSRIPFELKRILQEGAGMYMNVVRGKTRRYQFVLPCSGQVKYVYKHLYSYSETLTRWK